MKTFLILLLPLTLHAVIPDFSIQDDSVKITNVGPDNPIIYDNDWWYDVFDNNYLWAQTSLGKARLLGNIVSRDMWEWQKGYQYSFDQSRKDAEKALKLARDSGLNSLPDLTRGSDRALERPA